MCVQVKKKLVADNAINSGEREIGHASCFGLQVGRARPRERRSRAT